MNSIKKTFGSLFLVAVMVISIFCGGFSQTVLAETITITTKFTMKNAEIYRVITKDKGGGVYEVIEKGPMESGVPIQIRYDSSESIIVSYFAKPDPGYLITGTGASGEGNMSLVSELHDPEKKKKRTEGKVPEDVLAELEQNGYIIAWGYTKSSGNRSDITSSVVGYRPTVNSTITNTSGDIEPGKPITMEVIIRPASAFQGTNDNREYETRIPEGGATVTIDDKKVIPVTDINRENKNLYKGTITFELGDDDASVNTHTAVVNASVDYKMQLAMNTGNYKSDVPVTTTTTVDAKPATVSFNLISGPSRKLIYDLNYPGAETIEPEYHNSGTSVTVRSDNYVRPGYEFGGWDTLDSQGNAVNRKPSETFHMPDRVTGTKLTARWRPYLTVDCDNGSAVYTNAYEIGSIATPVRPVKQDYYFSGWRDENGREYGVNEDIIMPDRPLSIKAGWYNTIAGVPQFMRPALTNDKPKTGDVVDKNTEDKTEKNVDKKTENKTENKTDKKAVDKTADKKTENKTDKKDADKTADKKTENKTDKKAADKKTENKTNKTTENKTDKTTDNKTENKADKKTENKTDKKTENKTDKKTADKKAENKTDKKTVSGKKEQQEAKSGKNTDKKPSEGRDEKKNTPKNQEKNKPDVTKQETAEEGTQADDLDSKAEDEISDAESEKDTDGNTEDKISDDTEDKETTEDEVSKEDGKEKKTAENDKKKNTPENEKTKKSTPDTTAVKGDKSGSSSGNNKLDSSSGSNKSDSSSGNGNQAASSGKNNSQASQPARTSASVTAAGRGGTGIIDPKTGLPRDFVNGAGSRSETNKTHAFGVGQDQGFEILLYDEQGIPLYGNKAGILIYRGKVLKNSNILKNGKILKKGKLLVDGKLFTIASKTLPVTGGRVNVEFWLGLSILSALGVYKLFETKRKKVK